MKTIGMKAFIFLLILFFALPNYGQETNVVIDSLKCIELENMPNQIKEMNEPIPIDRQDGFYATIDYDPNIEKGKIRLEEKPSITKDDIQSVEKNVDMYGMQIISISLTEDGANKFYILTKNNISKPIAIVVDRHIIAMPIVSAEISEGKAIISGVRSAEEIDEIIKRLKE